MFGHKAEQIIGKSLDLLLPVSQHFHLNQQLQKNPDAIIGISREIEGLRRNGKLFLMDAMISKVTRENEPYFIGTLRDITDKKHIENQRIQFINDINRDLRTPLTALSDSILQLNIKGNHQLPKELQRLVGLSAQASVQLQNIMCNLAEQQNITQLPLRPEKQPLLQLVENCVKRNHILGDVYQITIKIFSPRNHWLVNIDSSHFDHALTYLLHRAIKKTSSRGEVRVVVNEEQGKIKVSIQTTATIDLNHPVEPTNESTDSTAEQERLTNSMNEMHAIIYFGNSDNKQIALDPQAIHPYILLPLMLQ
jgi:two-component system, LuxR family, sensor kinase FixL